MSPIPGCLFKTGLYRFLLDLGLAILNAVESLEVRRDELE